MMSYNVNGRNVHKSADMEIDSIVYGANLAELEPSFLTHHDITKRLMLLFKGRGVPKSQWLTLRSLTVLSEQPVCLI